MTVNELLATLRRLQRDGRGNNTVFMYNESTITDDEGTRSTPVPRVTHVSTHHSPQNGHIVIGSNAKYTDE